MQAVLFDLDGVLYEGERPVPGAAETVAWFQARGVPHLFITNTTSCPRAALVQRLARQGIRTDVAHVLTPPVAAAQWLRAHAPGPAALFVPEPVREDFDSVPLDGEAPSAVVVGDLGPAWDFSLLNHAFRLLMAEPQPTLIALGLTRYWRAEDGLRLDVGPFVAALVQASGAKPVVTGKPEAAYYRTALELLGTRATETLMIGDDIHGDIAGAQAVGMRAVQVRTGKFQPRDLALGISPDAVLASVADLPALWEAWN